MAQQFLVGSEADRWRVTAHETIFALSSGAVPAGIAVIRASGPGAPGLLDTLILGVRPAPRYASLRTIVGADGGKLDRGLVLFFPSPNSATGEDVVEFHIHGGPAVVAALLAAIGSQPNCRLARPGEFTRRGFDAGRLDLSQVEGIADLVAAETEAQRIAALAQSGGSLKCAIERWQDALTSALAATEAAIDFSDEDDVGGDWRSEDANLASILGEMRDALADEHRARALRDGLTIVVSGPPNVGKSSLVNALTNDRVSIVSALPGTTRDAISVRLDLGGMNVTLTDTAGIRSTTDAIESEGVEIAERLAGEADLVLSLYCDGMPPASGVPVRTKIDLSGNASAEQLAVSSTTGEGISSLLVWLGNWARDAVRPGEPPLLMRSRQRAACRAAADEITRAVDGTDIVLRAESLRMARRELGLITGQVAVEEVLDVLFGQFCIGK